MIAIIEKKVVLLLVCICLKYNRAMKNFRLKSYVQLQVGLLLGLMVLCISILGILTHRSNQNAVEHLKAVRLLQKSIKQVEDFSDLYEDLQHEHNGFLISGEFTTPLTIHAKLDLWNGLEEISAFKAENPQYEHQRSLLSNLGAKDPAFLLSGTDVNGFLQKEISFNSETLNIIQGHIRQLKEGMSLLLLQRKEDNKTSILAINRIFYLLLGGMGYLLILAFFSINHYFSKWALVQNTFSDPHYLFEKRFKNSGFGSQMVKAGKFAGGSLG
jgi:hypothetical protein